MNTLYVQVYSGLGSRMRAVIAAIAWARANDCKVCVCWPWKDPSETLRVFPVLFSELFDSLLSERRMDGPVIKAAEWPKYPEVINGELRCRTCDPHDLRVDELDLDGWPYPEMWRPGQIVEECINDVGWPSGKVVGVHIRHSLAQPQTPPVEWFLTRMREVRDEYNPSFFLSADAQEVEDRVRSEFPDVICQKRIYMYDRLGIARAAADLFLLQRCDWMIGSYHSSFSELAGWLRGGAYLPGWGRPGWMPGGRYEDAMTPPTGIEEALS